MAETRRAPGADKRAGERISRCADPAAEIVLAGRRAAALVPVALAIGVNPAYIVASAPACYGYYILPTYPSDLAAIQFDRSGTTRIGRRDQPQLYSARPDRRQRLLRLRLDPRRGVRFLMSCISDRGLPKHAAIHGYRG